MDAAIFVASLIAVVILPGLLVGWRARLSVPGCSAGGTGDYVWHRRCWCTNKQRVWGWLALADGRDHLAGCRCAGGIVGASGARTGSVDASADASSLGSKRLASGCWCGRGCTEHRRNVLELLGGYATWHQQCLPRLGRALARECAGVYQ